MNKCCFFCKKPVPRTADKECLQCGFLLTIDTEDDWKVVAIKRFIEANVQKPSDWEDVNYLELLSTPSNYELPRTTWNFNFTGAASIRVHTSRGNAFFISTDNPIKPMWISSSHIFLGLGTEFVANIETENLSVAVRMKVYLNLHTLDVVFMFANVDDDAQDEYSRSKI
jgi:hypothetical protein